MDIKNNSVNIYVANNGKTINYRFSNFYKGEKVYSDTVETNNILDEACIKVFLSSDIIDIKRLKFSKSSEDIGEHLQVKNCDGTILNITSDDLDMHFTALLSLINERRSEDYKNYTIKFLHNNVFSVKDIIFDLTKDNSGVSIVDFDEGTKLYCNIPYEQVKNRIMIDKRDLQMVQDIINYYVSLINFEVSSIYVKDGAVSVANESVIFTKKANITIKNFKLNRDLSLYLSVLHRELDQRSKDKRRL